MAAGAHNSDRVTKYYSDIENNRHTETMADKLKTPQKSSWWGGSSGKPPWKNFIFPFVVMPEHWEKTFDNTINKYELTPEMYIHHQLNELCFFSDMILVLSLFTLYFLLLTMLYNNIYIVKHFNSYFDSIKPSKFTKLLKKNLSMFFNMNTKFWLLFLLINLIWISYKTQQFHMELLDLANVIDKKG